MKLIYHLKFLYLNCDITKNKLIKQYIESNNYLTGIEFLKEYHSKNKYGIAFLDISTGEFSLANCDYDQLEKLVNIYDPSELLCSKDDKSLISEKFKGKNIFSLDNWVFKMGYSYDKLISFFNVKNLKGYGV